MALVFKVGEDKDLSEKPENWPQCGDFNQKSVETPLTTTKAVQLNLQNLNRTLLEAIYANSLNDLKFIDLSNKNIQSIDSSTFQDLTNLESLYLHQNKLSSINSNTFKGLNNLKELSLHSNSVNNNLNLLFNINYIEIIIFID